MGTYIKVVVNTGAKKEKVEQKSKDHFNISVKEKAERNMANNRILELLAIFFKISQGKIRIVNGHHHPHKLLFVDADL